MPVDIQGSPEPSIKRLIPSPVFLGNLAKSKFSFGVLLFLPPPPKASRLCLPVLSSGEFSNQNLSNNPLRVLLGLY